jgi:hypothetical protein
MDERGVADGELSDATRRRPDLWCAGEPLMVSITSPTIRADWRE